jgi:pre-mRNA-splicing factor 38A
MELIETFLEQDHFKYLKALGAFYLRLTGRPQDIYECLEPLYADYSKLKYRDVNEWKLIHLDEFIDELLTKPFACGIALPRLPRREILHDAGYLEEGHRPTELKHDLQKAGGVKELLKLKADQEVQENAECIGGAVTLWEKRFGDLGKNAEKVPASIAASSEKIDANDRPLIRTKRKADGEEVDVEKQKKKKRIKAGSHSLFKKLKAESAHISSISDRPLGPPEEGSEEFCILQPPEEGSEEFWNLQRAKLGLKPLKK